MKDENSFEENLDEELPDNSGVFDNGIKKKKIILIILIVFIVILLFAIGFGVLNIHKHNTEQSLFDAADSDLFEKNRLNEKQKKFIGLSDGGKKELTYKEEKNYTNSYKKYLELSDKEKEKLEVIPREEEIPIEKLDELEDEIIIEDKIPSSFNLSDKIKLHVSNQGPWGLCWDFASMKTLETFMALNGQNNYNFSEIHVDYLTSNLLYGFRGKHNGGNFAIFEDYLQLTGPVLENNLSYRDYGEDEYKSFIDIEPTARVIKTVDFPSLDKDATEQQIQDFRNLVKSHIMKNGALYATTVSETIRNGFDETVNEDKTVETTQYCKGECYSNHAVAIVGWDDNYSKENFMDKNGKKPKNDGAYIALNSWGSDWGNNGYFYISYEDENVEEEMSGILSTSLEDGLRINSINNQNVKNYLKEHYGQLFIKYNNEEYLTDITLQSIKTLKLENANLTSNDLKQIVSIFPNLWQLKLANNNIDDVTALNDFKSEWMDVDLANNKITNISTLTADNISTLNLAGNKIVNINSLNNLSKLYSVNISNNPINWSETNLTNINIWEMLISNTNFADINLLKNSKNISVLDISKNPINSLEGIQNLPIYEINLSETKITDFKLLDDVYREKLSDEFNEEIGAEYKTFVSVIANNCDISDITLFNDLKINSLVLENNKIKDVSKFKNNNVTYVDLSGNTNITGLQGLNNIRAVILANNNLTNLDEVLKLNEVVSLDLSYNSIDDFSGLQNLKNLVDLSLEGNSNVNLNTLPEYVHSLNVKNCNLDNNADFSKFSDLWMINISNNTKFVNFDTLFDVKEEQYRSVVMEGYKLSPENIETIEKIENVYMMGASVVLNYSNLTESHKLSLDFGAWMNKYLMKNMLNDDIIAKNVILNKNAKEITIVGNNPVIHTDYSYDVFIENN